MTTSITANLARCQYDNDICILLRPDHTLEFKKYAELHNIHWNDKRLISQTTIMNMHLCEITS